MCITVYKNCLWDLFLDLGLDSVQPRCHNGSTVIALGYKFVHASMFLQEPKGTGCYFLCPFLPCHILKFD
ncbi:hypothetical protein NQZ68_019252 [Dissostichus eleginoides]|nr:hypothetical protein NQZ68_019252 [Dissostichus eleginoides]